MVESDVVITFCCGSAVLSSSLLSLLEVRGDGDEAFPAFLFLRRDGSCAVSQSESLEEEGGQVIASSSSSFPCCPDWAGKEQGGIDSYFPRAVPASITTPSAPSSHHDSKDDEDIINLCSNSDDDMDMDDDDDSDIITRSDLDGVSHVSVHVPVVIAVAAEVDDVRVVFAVVVS
jgi:hypothetical protein